MFVIFLFNVSKYCLSFTFFVCLLINKYYVYAICRDTGSKIHRELRYIDKLEREAMGI